MSIELSILDKEQALTVPEQAKTFTIANNDGYAKGEEFLATCKQLEDRVHEDLDGVVKIAYSSWKASVALRDKYLVPLEEGRRILKQKMIAFQQEEEKKRQEAQRLAEEEARKREEDQKLADALAAEQSGDTETAEAILEEPIAPPPVIIPKTAPKASRLSAGRTVYYAEVTNLMELCKAIVEKRQPISLIEANMVALNKLASALKSTMAIPGVVAKSKTV